jgi:hypothetical protein
MNKFETLIHPRPYENFVAFQGQLVAVALVSDKRVKAVLCVCTALIACLELTVENKEFS